MSNKRHSFHVDLWRGNGDGHYSVAAGPEHPEQGTTVSLRPRRGCEHWLATAAVAELVRSYGGLLPPVRRRRPCRARGRTYRHGVRAARGGPSERAPRTGLYPLPERAFFARCVVSTTELRPTAARELLYEDELLGSTRQALGKQLRGTGARPTRPSTAGFRSTPPTRASVRPTRSICTTTCCCPISARGDSRRRAAHLRTRHRDMEGRQLARHLEFCARSGNEEAGRELMLRNVEWVGGSVMTCYQLNIWGAAVLLCRRLVERDRLPL